MARQIPGLVKKVEYKDIDIHFQANPNGGDVPYLANDKAITQAIKNLVFTNLYERPYKSKIASDVLRSLFENFTPAAVNILRNRIRDVIVNYEPRADLIDVTIDWRDEYHEMKVDILYRPMNARDPITITVFLEKLR